MQEPPALHPVSPRLCGPTAACWRWRAVVGSPGTAGLHVCAPWASTHPTPGPLLRPQHCGPSSENRSAIGGDQAHSNSLCHSFRGGHPGGFPKSRCAGALHSHPGPAFWVPSPAPLFRWESRCPDSFLVDAGTFPALLHCCDHSYPAGGSCSLHSDLHT